MKIIVYNILSPIWHLICITEGYFIILQFPSIKARILVVFINTIIRFKFIKMLLQLEKKLYRQNSQKIIILVINSMVQKWGLLKKII